MYERLTKYAGTLAGRKTEAPDSWWTVGMGDFIDDFYGLEGFTDTGYMDTLERYGVEMSYDGFAACDVEHADIALVRALITTCVRQDRFCDGLLGSFARNGFLDRCLTRLMELDEG